MENVYKINDYIYSARITNLEYPEPYKKYNENEKVYMTYIPRGLENSDEIYVFLSGCSIFDIPEDAIRSFSGPLDKSQFIDANRLVINTIYSINDKEGFVYWDTP